MANERGQNTHSKGERVKIPLFPYNAYKRVCYQYQDRTSGHDSFQLSIQISLYGQTEIRDAFYCLLKSVKPTFLSTWAGTKTTQSYFIGPPSIDPIIKLIVQLNYCIYCFVPPVISYKLK